MPINDPAVLADPFRGAVVAWLAAGRGAFWISSGLRTRQEQIDLRVSNGCPDVWSSPASSCRVPTAIPGTSKHEIGQAVDIGGDRELAARLGPTYGLGRTVPSESWHFECVDTNAASRWPYRKDLFSMGEVDRIVNAIQEQGQQTRRTIQTQAELGRKQVRRQALLTRLEVKKAAKADQRDLDAILDELKALGPEEAEG